MNSRAQRRERLLDLALLVIVANLAALAVAAFAIGPPPGLPEPRNEAPAKRPGPSPKERPIAPGIRAKIVGGGIEVERWLATPSFSIEPGGSLDRRVPSGPQEVALEIGFDPRRVERAAFGVEFAGASVRVEAGGRVLLEEAVPEGGLARTVLSGPIAVSSPLTALRLVVAWDGTRTARLRVLWQPQGERVPHPLPAASPEWTQDEVLAGELAVELRGCAGCHPSGDMLLDERLMAAPAPDLGQVGARLAPEWIRSWLADPSLVKPGTPMPRLFGDDEASRDAIEDLTHFLASLGGPAPAEDRPDPDLALTGQVAYHTTGCVVCHGPLDGGVPGSAKPGSGEPLGTLAAKWRPAALAAFLRDPAAVHPAGRMPGMFLGELEAKALAAFLILGRPSGSAPPEGFALVPERAERGREAFRRRRCAACHALGEREPAGDGFAVPGPPLESLREGRGCLDPAPGARGVRYDLSDRSRREIGAFLASLSGRRCEEIPLDRLSVGLLRMNCLACHAYAGAGGPDLERQRYFTASRESDLGNEGRFPPDLTDVGARLTPSWLREILVTEGRSRPHLAVRMPRFGGAMEALARDLVRASGAGEEPDDGPEPARDASTIGRHLVGVGGHDCVSCHGIDGRPSSGTPGVDLAGVGERLRHGYFVRWMECPTAVRSGTKMPTFFGRDAPEDAAAKIDAIWAYLSLGEGLPLPDGVGGERTLVLSVRGEPIVMRTFMRGIGPRAIACGFPEGIHLAFDASQSRLAYVWEGTFLDASGAWANRGGQETNPSSGESWTSPGGPDVVVGSEPPDPWPDRVDPDLVRFRGYRLDHERRPVFLSEWRGPAGTIRVAEQPIPARRDGRAALVRHFSLEGPPGTTVWIRSPGGPIRVVLSDEGRADLETEVTW
ncbi:MAG: c-type cytochrome [Planctomycetes bacterium]|nr:c-type cytochrome [Planctomycetota bacterium]